MGPLCPSVVRKISPAPAVVHLAEGLGLSCLAARSGTLQSCLAPPTRREGGAMPGREWALFSDSCDSPRSKQLPGLPAPPIPGLGLQATGQACVLRGAMEPTGEQGGARALGDHGLHSWGFQRR
uniref:Uncharacterized protein n=1 Tax=Myotis myotis TaxID=51298 RepID=A0A7J7UP99_MYOMY|nr:hypothetical protein mMyoMyo1_008543 [Myotis myotis]